MARPRPAAPVTLLVALLSGDADLLRRARQKLIHRFGPADLESDVWPFDQTDHYEAEMGGGLLRQLISFRTLIRPEGLPDIKLETGRFEREIAEECEALLDVPRPVNIDPGYLDLSKLVRASTKDRGHRVYLDKGIYAEVVLHFTNGAWRAWPWTESDHQQPACHDFLARVCDRLREQRRAAEAGDDATEREGRG